MARIDDDLEVEDQDGIDVELTEDEGKPAKSRKIEDDIEADEPRRRTSKKDDDGEDDIKSDIARAKREASELKAQLAELAKTQNATAIATIERDLAAAENDLIQAKNAKRQALAANNLVLADQIQDELINAIKQKRDDLAYQREATASRPAQRQASGPSAQAEKWMAKNKWFDPKGGDDTTEVVHTISRRLVGEGYDAEDPEHFRLLDERLARLGIGSKRASRSTQTVAAGGSSSGSAPAPRKGTIRIPKALYENARAAGIDVSDPKELKDLARHYQSTQERNKERRDATR
jgi:hypothetical protein